MKKFTEYVIGVLVLFLFTFLIPTPIFAAVATVPNLGTAADFAVLASSTLNCTHAGAGCSFSGNYGLSPGTSTDSIGLWPVSNGYFGDTASPNNLISSNAKADALTAYNNLAGQTGSQSWSGSGSTTPAAGVWKSSDATTTFNGTLTLNGGYNDVWVFQIEGDFNFTGEIVMTGNAQPCHVFWQIVGNTNITETNHGYFKGTVIALGNIHVVSEGTIEGRIISLNGSLSMEGSSTNNIQAPACNCGLTLNKIVDNTNGGAATIFDWLLTANGATTTPTNLTGSTTVNESSAPPNDYYTTFKPDTYTLAESGGLSDYTASPWVCVGGTQTGDSTIVIGVGVGAVCTITNTYPAAVIITPPPPPHGCSGCGGRVLPQIKVTKTANPQTLPASGGMVTYTENITNPGFYAIGNIKITDNKCDPLQYISGDANRNSWLDTNETWTYSCRTKIAETTTNTVTAEGSAYGMTARDSATATVVVVPKLPNTGFAPKTSAFYRSLSTGAQGADVVALQTALEQKDLLTIPSGVAKGYFGALTRKAVTKYQANVNLPTVGIFGPLTRAKLTSELGE